MKNLRKVMVCCTTLFPCQGDTGGGKEIFE
jgi:hypothetical protein